MILEDSPKNNNGWRNKLFFLIGIIILVLVVINLAKSWTQTHQINQEIAGLEEEIVNLEQNNLGLKQLIEYFNSDAYIEEKARLDLGLKKEGEKLVIVADQNTEQKDNQKNLSEDEAEQKQNNSNPKKWWHYFFN